MSFANISSFFDNIVISVSDSLNSTAPSIFANTDMIEEVKALKELIDAISKEFAKTEAEIMEAKDPLRVAHLFLIGKELADLLEQKKEEAYEMALHMEAMRLEILGKRSGEGNQTSAVMNGANLFERRKTKAEPMDFEDEQDMETASETSSAVKAEPLF